MDPKDLQAIDHLNALTGVSWQVIREKSVAGTLRPMSESYPYIGIEGFNYGENGPGYSGSSHETRFRPDWRRAAFDIHELVAPSAVYRNAQDYLAANFTYPHATHLFRQYAFKLYDILLEHQPQVINVTAVEAHYIRFLRDLNQAAHPAKATVYLSGIIIESAEIVLDDHCLLRQTRENDMAALRHHGGSVTMVAYPSAVLEISYERKYNDYGVIHEAMGKYVLLLRLFRAASVERNYYQIEFETVTAPKKASSGDEGSLLVWRKYRLKKEEETAFLAFIKNFKLPANFGVHGRNPDHVSTAHDRYRESLLENVPVERRIANAIMGLEALISDKNAELNYRLSNRAAKSLVFFNLNPLQVRKNLIKAYDIRSKYAHGGFVKPAERNKITAELGSVDEFAYIIINYLRTLLIITTQCGMAKSALLTLIDDALIDSQSHDQLEQTVASTRQFF